jgi:hypothetical protein
VLSARQALLSARQALLSARLTDSGSRTARFLTQVSCVQNNVNAVKNKQSEAFNFDQFTSRVNWLSLEVGLDTQLVMFVYWQTLVTTLPSLFEGFAFASCMFLKAFGFYCFPASPSLH